MTEETCGGWLSEQVRVSAWRLTNRPPSLLSPTGQALKAWIETASHSGGSQREVRQLRIVHRTAKLQGDEGPPQLPLITAVQDPHPTRA